MERGLRDLAREVAALAIRRQPTLRLHALYLELSGCSAAAREALAAFVATGGFTQQKLLAQELGQLRGIGGLSAETLNTIYQALLQRQIEILSREPTLPNYVFHLDFSQRWTPGQENLAAYLAGLIDVERQNVHLTELGDLFKREGASQDPTLLLLRSLTASQFDAWRPLRHRYLEQTAAGRAAKAVRGVGQVLGILVLLPVLLACFNGFLFASSAWGQFGFFMGAVVLLIGSLAGWTMVREQMLQKNLQREREQLQDYEDQWSDWLGLTR